jgi:hypothetical protein
VWFDTWFHVASKTFLEKGVDRVYVIVVNSPAMKGVTSMKIKSIQAEVHSDDFCMQTQFDSLPWFEQASDEEILELIACNWRGDYPADNVAHFISSENTRVRNVLTYVETAYEVTGKIGFEVSVNDDDALVWLKQHRPHLAKEAQEV